MFRLRSCGRVATTCEKAASHIFSITLFPFFFCSTWKIYDDDDLTFACVVVNGKKILTMSLAFLFFFAPVSLSLYSVLGLMWRRGEKSRFFFSLLLLACYFFLRLLNMIYTRTRKRQGGVEWKKFFIHPKREEEINFPHIIIGKNCV